MRPRRAPVKKLPRAELLRRASRIRLLAMDVDGVLTDGAIIVLNSGEEVKFWNVRDRIGFFMLRECGKAFRTAWITGRESLQVKTRAKELNIGRLYQRCEDKGRAYLETVKAFGLSPEEGLFIGDDLVDLPAFRHAGLAVCPGDAHPAVKDACHWTTRAVGGRGVFREVADLVLRSQGLWEGVLAKFESPAAKVRNKG